jgi:hypothetical protein
VDFQRAVLERADGLDGGPGGGPLGRIFKSKEVQHGLKLALDLIEGP